MIARYPCDCGDSQGILHVLQGCLMKLTSLAGILNKTADDLSIVMIYLSGQSDCHAAAVIGSIHLMQAQRVRAM